MNSWHFHLYFIQSSLCINGKVAFISLDVFCIEMIHLLLNILMHECINLHVSLKRNCIITASQLHNLHPSERCRTVLRCSCLISLLSMWSVLTSTFSWRGAFQDQESCITSCWDVQWWHWFTSQVNGCSTHQKLHFCLTFKHVALLNATFWCTF